MAQELIVPGPVAVIEYKNKKPVDLLELTVSLRAIGQAYRRYAAQELPEGSRARLAIGTLETGSIIAKLVPMLEAADWLIGHRDIVGPFVAQFGEIMETIRSFPPKARALPKEDVRAAKDVTKPLNGDKDAQFNIYAAEGAHIVTNVYNFGPNGMSDIRKHADIILGGFPGEYAIENQPMVLFQLRDGPAGPTGDYGFIDRFSDQPVRIRWLSAEAKDAVIGRRENVFDFVYFVSGTARTAGGAIATYDIRRVEDVALKPPGARHA
ncbi:hypothetical protein [Sphingomonas sp. Leaf28]|uniref:hypothetical protein n=1 Tax=Sphingomonas sp. Leaf28 TaxID=1735695 RepID=UPI0006FCB318|nr:hypothetical protein [Sphingomonas sp. Leaf28]KQN12019.1 hypothetical protein ASE79_08350 [Sphingomonas sp. Leaf28]